jgi:hypothetical protein
MDIEQVFRYGPKAVEGVWTSYEDAELKIARWNNEAHRSGIQKLYRKFGGKRSGISEALSEKIGIEAMADNILMDWKNVTENGADLPATRENRVRLLSDYPDFRDDVFHLSRDPDLFSEEKQEKN